MYIYLEFGNIVKMDFPYILKYMCKWDYGS